MIIIWNNRDYLNLSLYFPKVIWCDKRAPCVYPKQMDVALDSYQIRRIAGWACARNAGNSPHQRNPVVSDPCMHHGNSGTHVPRCMSGSLTRGGGENVPGIPGACATHNFAYQVRGPYSSWFVGFMYTCILSFRHVIYGGYIYNLSFPQVLTNHSPMQIQIISLGWLDCTYILSIPLSTPRERVTDCRGCQQEYFAAVSRMNVVTIGLGSLFASVVIVTSGL